MSNSAADSVISDSGPKHSTMANRKELHDLLLAQMPEGAVHETCSLCLSSTDDTPEGGTQVDKLYSEEELQTAVANATAELAAETKAMKADAAESELEAAVSAVKAEAAAEIEELKAKLDTAVLAAQAARAEHEGFVAELNEFAAAEAAAEETASRREARLEEARAIFSDEEYLAENADRFAAMSDDEWESRKSDWAAVAPKVESAAAADTIPSKTALTASRDESTNSNSGMSVIRGAMRGVLVGRDPRTL